MSSSPVAKAFQQLDSLEPHAIRRACWLARAALESLIDDLLIAKGIQAERASERARLSCLEGAYHDDRDLAHKAEYAWSRLSDACHQHAYLLSPTYSEARHLIELVEHLGTGATRSNSEGPTA
jgi:hypothetical protein